MIFGFIIWHHINPQEITSKTPAMKLIAFVYLKLNAFNFRIKLQYSDLIVAPEHVDLFMLPRVNPMPFQTSLTIA